MASWIDAATSSIGGRSSAAAEKLAQHSAFVFLQAGPLGRSFFQVKGKLFFGGEAEPLGLFLLFDFEKAAHGQVHDDGGDVAHIG